MTRKVGIAALAAGALLTAPAGADKVAKYDARFNAKYPAVAAAKTVGVLNFNGKDGDHFTSTLISELQSATLDGQPQFAVKTLDSMNFRSDSAISKAEVAAAIRQGQKLGVAVVFTGSTTTVAINANKFNKQMQDCDGKNCRTVNVPCDGVIGQYSVAPRAIRVDTGAVIYSEAVSAKGEYAVCNGVLQDRNTGSIVGMLNNLGNSLGGLFKKPQPKTTTAINTPDALLESLRGQAARQVRELVAPYNRTVMVAMKEKAPGLAKADAAQFASAVAFGGAGRMDRACNIFETMNTGANVNNVALLYNLGVCQEVLLPEQPGAALAYYAKADGLLSKPDKLISDAYLRTKGLVGQSRGLGK